MGKIRVPIYNTPSKSALIDSDATRGAVIGDNVFNPDGSLFAPDAVATPAEGNDVSVTVWRLILEVPPNVTALETAVGTGLFVVTGSKTGAFRSIQPVAGETTVTNGDGVSDDPIIGLADVADAGGGTLQKTAFDTKGRKTGTSSATTDNLPEGDDNLYFTAARVRATLLTGLSLASAAVISATDTVLSALGNLQGQITALAASLSGYVPTSRTISTTAPLTGGGDLSASRTLAISAATTGAAGSMSAADKTKLNGVATGATAYTDALARSAVVIDSIADGDTDHAPSRNSVFDSLALKANVNAPAFTGDASFDGGTLFVDSVNDRVGIGTSSPTFQFHVEGSSGGILLNRTGGSEAFISIQNNGGGGAQIRSLNFGGLRFTDRTSVTEWWRINGAGVMHPGSDNTYPLGASSFRPSVIYAATGAINTSDAREKTEPRDLSQHELSCAVELSRLPCIYQWLYAIKEKGDDARLHCSPTVQSVISTMKSHGLDPFRYGFVCYDEWEGRTEPAQVDGEGNEIAPSVTHPAGNRYSLRPSELAHFIMRGIVARQDAMESRLAALDS